MVVAIFPPQENIIILIVRTGGTIFSASFAVNADGLLCRWVVVASLRRRCSPTPPHEGIALQPTFPFYSHLLLERFITTGSSRMETASQGTRSCPRSCLPCGLNRECKARARAPMLLRRDGQCLRGGHVSQERERRNFW